MILEVTKIRYNLVNKLTIVQNILCKIKYFILNKIFCTIYITAAPLAITTCTSVPVTVNVSCEMCVNVNVVPVKS